MFAKSELRSQKDSFPVSTIDVRPTGASLAALVGDGCGLSCAGRQGVQVAQEQPNENRR